MSATHVAILRWERYKGSIHRDITKVCEPIHRCRAKLLSFTTFSSKNVRIWSDLCMRLWWEQVKNLRWVGYTAYMRYMRNKYPVWLGKRTVKWANRRLWHRRIWQDNIKVDFQEIRGWFTLNWGTLDKFCVCDLLNLSMERQFLKKKSSQCQEIISFRKKSFRRVIRLFRRMAVRIRPLL